MKKALIPFLGALVLLTTYACNNDDDNTTTPTPVAPARLTATLSTPTSTTGSSTTVTSSTATGSFTGTLDQVTNVMNYTVTYSGLTPTAITMDPTSTTGGTGTSPGSLTLTNPGSTTGTAISSPFSGSAPITANQATSVLNGGYQLNIRSTRYPDGELRGTVTRQP